MSNHTTTVIVALMTVLITATAASQTSTTHRKWQSTRTEDPMTDDVVAVLYTDEEPAIFGGARLNIRCKDSVLELFVQWNQFIDTANSVGVHFRVGKDPVLTSIWWVGANNSTTFYAGTPEDTRELINAMAAADRFAVAITPWNDNPRTVVFSLAGLTAALKTLPAECAVR